MNSPIPLSLIGTELLEPVGTLVRVIAYNLEVRMQMNCSSIFQPPVFFSLFAHGPSCRTECGGITLSAVGICMTMVSFLFG